MAHEPRFAREWHRCWAYVTDVALTIWVLRAPVAGLIAGYAILWFTPQAQDLLVDLTSAGWTTHFKFFALVIFVWAMPTEYAASILLNTDERYCAPTDRARYQFRKWLRAWAPSILGGLVFVCMLGSVFRSLENVPTVEVEHYTLQTKEQLILIAIGLFATLVGFYCYVRARPQIAVLPAVEWAERLAGRILRPLRRHLPPIFALKCNPEGCSEIESDLGPVLLILLSIFFLALPMAFPLEFAGWFPRASVVPFVIGAWIPLLSFLSGLGRRLHFPIITVGLIVKTLLPLALSPNYEIRAIASVEGGPNAALSLNEAVRLWKKANHCGDEGILPVAKSDPCPRPIIVAAAGGASRAGFFTASVLGQLLDHVVPSGQSRDGANPAWAGQRLFALSTVSGSSVAAVMTVAAMAASGGDHKQPCRSKAGQLWFGGASPFTSETMDWRDCLENLMAGDFITPVFVGLMFHDSVRFLRLPDRGLLLENAFEKHFANSLDEAATAHCDRRSALECPFMSLRPTEDRWLPLLVLNGTSVGTGQRILTTALDNTYKPTERCAYPAQDGGCHIFVSAFRFHDLLQTGASKSSAQQNAAAKERDVRLSTAAHNSARFPLISPPGDIYGADNQIVDRLVDGGYFENFGAQTATELAEAIVAIDPKLNPFVLVLSNDPTVPQLENVGQRGAKQDPSRAERAEEGAWITDVSGPVKAFMHTRNARGVLAVDSMPAALARGHPKSCNVVQLRVWYEPTGELQARAISMSWWLSKPVQVYLHQQANFGTDPKLEEKNNGLSPNRFAVKKLLAALDESPVPSEGSALAVARKGLSVERITPGPQGGICDELATTSAHR
jgi:hypothetical protein